MNSRNLILNNYIKIHPRILEYNWEFRKWKTHVVVFFCRKILMEGQTEEEETIAHVYMSDTLWSVNVVFFLQVEGRL